MYEVVHEKKTTKTNLFYCNDKIVFVRDDDLPKRRRDRFIPYYETKIFLNFWENGLNSKWKKRKAESLILFGRFCDKVIRMGNREICAVSTGKTPPLIMMRESWLAVHDHTWQECHTLQRVWFIYCRKNWRSTEANSGDTNTNSGNRDRGDYNCKGAVSRPAVFCICCIIYYIFFSFFGQLVLRFTLFGAVSHLFILIKLVTQCGPRKFYFIFAWLRAMFDFFKQKRMNWTWQKYISVLAKHWGWCLLEEIPTDKFNAFLTDLPNGRYMSN